MKRHVRIWIVWGFHLGSRQSRRHAILGAVEHRQGTRAEALAREHAQLSRRNLEMSLIDEDIRNYVPGSPLILV